MLTTLQIENVAVIEKASVTFGPGLTVLTGETGAGKSIVIDAVSAVLGGRCSKDLIRTGADFAKITAVFEIDPCAPWLESLDVEADEEGVLVLRRKISADGKSACRINGVPVSVTQLRQLGQRLLDIHGQHEGQKLLDEASHRAYLDSFGEISDCLFAYQDAYHAFQAVQAEMDALTLDEGEKARRIDNLHFQIEELAGATIKVGEYDALDSRVALLKNAAKLTDALNTALFALRGGDRTDGAVSLIGQAEDAIANAARYGDGFSEISAALSDLRYTAEDVAERLRDLSSDLEFYPGELDDVENRLAVLRRLFKKYGEDEAELLSYLERCKTELDDMVFASDRLAKLEKILLEKRAAADQAAKILSDARRAAALALETRIMQELLQLSMPGVRFSVDFRPKNELDASGGDNIAFLMSANVGENLGRISKIASGGELSRIMLALKHVLAENEEIGTMVFDEVDAGVSGVAAQRVGEKLSDLARRKQVLCVTHLPQIAAMADRHIEIEKTALAGRTHTKLNSLDEAGRRREIARLAGGDIITETTLKSAQEQIAAACAYKGKK